MYVTLDGLVDLAVAATDRADIAEWLSDTVTLDARLCALIPWLLGSPHGLHGLMVG